MNTLQNEHMHKKRLWEDRKEMLENYKVKRSKKDVSTNIEHLEHSHDELLNVEQSMLHKDSNVTEDISGRDVTDSSISICEREANAKWEGLAEYFVELNQVKEKKRIVGILNAAVDHLGAEACSPNTSQSQSQRQSQSSIEGRDISFNRTKSLYIVKQLEEFKRFNALNFMQLVNHEIKNMNTQQKIKLLEITINIQQELVCPLNAQLTEYFNSYFEH